MHTPFVFALAVLAIAMFTATTSFAQAPSSPAVASQTPTNLRTAPFGVWDNSTNPIVNDKSIRITNKRAGVVNQVVINTLSDDNNSISNEYIRIDKDGKITGVTHVTYIRHKK